MNIPNRLKLVSVAQMQRIEKAADARGHSYAAMMEMAGRAVAAAVENAVKNAVEDAATPAVRPVLVLAGPGNNGGDGLVCARYLHESGFPVRAYLWKRSTAPEDDYENHFAKLTELGVTTAHADEDDGLHTLRQWLGETGVLVDALLGTGTNRPISGQLGDILDAAKRAQTERDILCVGLDCVSGLNCDTGEVDAHALRADLTVTFAYAKWGHYKFPGAAHSGRICVADIGTPLELADDIRTFVLDGAWVAPLLPDRSTNSHKGSFGKVMASVGSMNFAGAAYLACATAARVGAGLVTGAIPQPVWAPIASKLAEPTWVPLPSTDDGQFDGARAAEQLLDKLSGYSALALGCGMGNSAATQEFVATVLQSPELPPLLIDADGLNALAQLEMGPSTLPETTVLTPHAAEMARLCGLSISEVLAQRWELARQKAAEWNVIVLVKGPYTVIAHPDGALAVLPIATPALATAGTGDVLSGTITSLLAQGLEPFDAACLGSWVHGKAGELCAVDIGLSGTLASDVIDRLPHVMQQMR